MSAVLNCLWQAPTLTPAVSAAIRPPAPVAAPGGKGVFWPCRPLYPRGFDEFHQGKIITISPSKNVKKIEAVTAP